MTDNYRFLQATGCLVKGETRSDSKTGDMQRIAHCLPLTMWLVDVWIALPWIQDKVANYK